MINLNKIFLYIKNMMNKIQWDYANKHCELYWISQFTFISVILSLFGVDPLIYISMIFFFGAIIVIQIFIGTLYDIFVRN